MDVEIGRQPRRARGPGRAHCGPRGWITKIEIARMAVIPVDWSGRRAATPGHGFL
jgi:hypothetical protein